MLELILPLDNVNAALKDFWHLGMKNFFDKWIWCPPGSCYNRWSCKCSGTTDELAWFRLLGIRTGSNRSLGLWTEVTKEGTVIGQMQNWHFFSARRLSGPPCMFKPPWTCSSTHRYIVSRTRYYNLNPDQNIWIPGHVADSRVRCYFQANTVPGSTWFLFTWAKFCNNLWFIRLKTVK